MATSGFLVKLVETLMADQLATRTPQHHELVAFTSAVQLQLSVVSAGSASRSLLACVLLNQDECLRRNEEQQKLLLRLFRTQMNSLPLARILRSGSTGLTVECSVTALTADKAAELGQVPWTLREEPASMDTLERMIAATDRAAFARRLSEMLHNLIGAVAPQSSERSAGRWLQASFGIWVPHDDVPVRSFVHELYAWDLELHAREMWAERLANESGYVARTVQAVRLRLQSRPIVDAHATLASWRADVRTSLSVAITADAPIASEMLQRVEADTGFIGFASPTPLRLSEVHRAATKSIAPALRRKLGAVPPPSSLTATPLASPQGSARSGASTEPQSQPHQSQPLEPGTASQQPPPSPRSAPSPLTALSMWGALLHTSKTQRARAGAAPQSSGSTRRAASTLRFPSPMILPAAQRNPVSFESPASTADLASFLSTFKASA
eukprot:c25493_g1_i1.p1 GENE.c25493_g1_i1~~c25493_g1_i1.p1  ORF type:complete len:471 (+),score=40.34 c25493_g1_i1:93-1415(+)